MKHFVLFLVMFYMISTIILFVGITLHQFYHPLSSHSSNMDVTVQNFERSMIDAPGPCVLFATPGMISGGFSLEVFKHWAPSEENLVTLPGYMPY